MAFYAVIRSRKVGGGRGPVMGDIFMAEDARKFPPAGDLFKTPGTKDLLDLPGLFVQLFSQDQDLLFLLLHIILMTFNAVSIQCLGHIGEPTRSIGKLAARMWAVAKGAGDALSMDLIFFP
jgi:hypothetical protein